VLNFFFTPHVDLFFSHQFIFVEFFRISIFFFGSHVDLFFL
jgi:hypothetical protein